MKKFMLFLCLLASILTVQGANRSDKNKIKLEKEKEMQELIESGSFRFIARSANPMSGPAINLTSTYDLKIDGDIIEAWLPFYGRAYHVKYGDREGGIKFKEQAEKSDLQFKSRKKTYEYIASVKTDGDMYELKLSAGLNGYGSLNINSRNRQSISFYGIIEALDKK